MIKQTETYVTGTLGRFVILYDGLAYWFEMKDQRLYRVSVLEEFFEFMEQMKDETREKFIYRPISGSILSPKLLLKKRRWFAAYPFTPEGTKRIGVELLPEYQELDQEQDEVKEENRWTR